MASWCHWWPRWGETSWAETRLGRAETEPRSPTPHKTPVAKITISAIIPRPHPGSRSAVVAISVQGVAWQVRMAQMTTQTHHGLGPPCPSTSPPLHPTLTGLAPRA